MRINAAKPAAVLPTRKAKAASATLFLILGSLFKAIGQYLVESDNGNVHRAAANIIVSKSRAARGSVCNVLLSGVYAAVSHDMNTY